MLLCHFFKCAYSNEQYRYSNINLENINQNGDIYNETILNYSERRYVLIKPFLLEYHHGLQINVQLKIIRQNRNPIPKSKTWGLVSFLWRPFIACRHSSDHDEGRYSYPTTLATGELVGADVTRLDNHVYFIHGHLIFPHKWMRRTSITPHAHSTSSVKTLTGHFNFDDNTSNYQFSSLDFSLIDFL